MLFYDRLVEKLFNQNNYEVFNCDTAFEEGHKSRNKFSLWIFIAVYTHTKMSELSREG